MPDNSVITPMPDSIRFDEGSHPRAKIGYVLLATEQTVQDDVIRLRPPGVGIHFTRAAIADSITNESLSAQADLLADCASSLLPDGSLDVVCYACTSGSLVIGEERVFTELNRGAPDAQATSLITGVIRALKTLQARRIVIATPYLDEVNQREVDYLEQAGFEVISICGLNLEKDSDMVRVPRTTSPSLRSRRTTPMPMRFLFPAAHYARWMSSVKSKHARVSRRFAATRR